MWNSLQSPDSDDLNAMLNPSPTGDSGATPQNQFDPILEQDSDSDDADYIPESLLSFVAQAHATLESTRQTFLSTAAADPPEPAVFCFDEGGRSTPPLEDEHDRNFQKDLLDRFQSRVDEDDRFDVAEILSKYNDNTGDAEEVLFSPDIQTPPPNPHYNITSASEARHLALGSPGLTVDTDILPFRPPHCDDSGSSSPAEDEGTDDPMAWLDSAVCDPNAHAILEDLPKKPDPPSQRAGSAPQTTTFQMDTMATPAARKTQAFTTTPVSHVGDVDETEGEEMEEAEIVVPPQAQPAAKHTPPPHEIQVVSKPAEPKVPMEVVVQEQKKAEAESSVPMVVSVENKESSKRKEPASKKVAIKPSPQTEPSATQKGKTTEKPSTTKPQPTSQTPAKRPTDDNSSRTTSSKKSSNHSLSVFERLYRPTTASATKAAAAKQTPSPANRSLQQTPPTYTPPIGSSTTKTSRPTQSTQRPLRTAQKPKNVDSTTQTTPGLRASATATAKSDEKVKPRKTPTATSNRVSRTSGEKVARKSTAPTRQSTLQAPITQNHKTPVSPKSGPAEKSQSSTARITRTFKQSDISSRIAKDSGDRHLQATSSQNAKKHSDVSSRLMQETTASKLRHTSTTNIDEPPEHPRKSPERISEVKVSSRLLQETASSKLHHTTTEEEKKVETSMSASPRHSLPEPHISGRLLQETTASKQKHAAQPEEQRQSISVKDIPQPSISSRLLQETEASRLRHAADEAAHFPVESVNHHNFQVTPIVSSRLLQETSAYKQRVVATAEHMQEHMTPEKNISTNDQELQASREKAQQRIRERIAREKEKDSASKAAAARQPKYSPEDGVARARERLRLRQLKERQEREKENVKKSTVSKGKRPTFVGVREPKRRPLTIPQGPNLSTSRRVSTRHTPPASTNSSESGRRITSNLATLTLAQSTDILRKGLRSDDNMSHSSTASARREVTIAHAPRFATSARYGEKLQSHGWKAECSLASSTRLLQTQLRGEDPSLMKKREFKLTIPEAPKLHDSSRRARPKSTAEIEDEMMKELNAHPFKALPYRPHAPPVAPKRKAVARPSTKPEPFHLASESRAASAAPKTVEPKAKDTEDDIELSKKFHARPMPSYPDPPQLRVSKTPQGSDPPTGANVPPERAVSPPNLRTSSRAERRLETAQAYNTHAEEARRLKEIEQKRRQREKHEQEIRKAEAIRAETSPARKRADAPFQLVSLARHEVSQQRLQEKLRQQEEEQKKASSFHARPFRPAPTPEQKRVSTRAPTSPEPFRLKSEERHISSQEKMRKQAQEVEQEFRRQTQFRARPVPSFDVSSPSAQPFLLASTARLRAFEEEKKKREEAELEEIRKLSQFKSRPVPLSTYQYVPPPRRSASRSASPNRPGIQHGHFHEINGGADHPIIIDVSRGHSPPGRPPVSTIVFPSS